MKIIYHCYGGTHSSVLAAALDTGILNMHKPLTWQDLFACPYFDTVDKRDTGKINYMGENASGDDVYTMGCKNAGFIVENVVKELGKVTQLDTSELIMVNTIPCLNNLMRLGGLLSRQLGLITAGRFFLFHGSQLAYPKIKQTVLQVNKMKHRYSTSSSV